MGIVLGTAKYCDPWCLASRICVFGGAWRTRGINERVDRSLAEGELVAARAREASVDARHGRIRIEGCKGDDIIIAPEGLSGNLIFRTLLPLYEAKSYGAPVLMERAFVSSNRARGLLTGR